MNLNKLSLHPRQYLKLEEPLRVYVQKNVTQTEIEIICQTLTKRRTPLVLTGKKVQSRSGQGQEWQYWLQMPTYSLKLVEGKDGHSNLMSVQFAPSDGNDAGYRSRFEQMFFIEAAEGIYFGSGGGTWFVKPGDDWKYCDAEDNVDWDMSPDGYDDLLERMHSYFEDREERLLSQRVSARMRENVMDPFEQYTQKEHEFETKKVDFTKGVRYEGRVAAGVSRGKKSSYELISNDPSADPENCTLTVGQRVAVYREDQSFTNLVGLLVEIDTSAEDGVRFVLEFYQQFDRDQLPKKGYLFVHQNDTQLRIRQNVAKTIRRGKTPAKYIYKTFHDFSVNEYEKLEDHPDLIAFLHGRMGRQFPPNQMQLEAIVKGILTEDLLLVLGPPGTGKTTVILSWVEYFLSQGKRVLISSQNNSAVDNVLERLDKDREIVRLGREEKVQGNCKEYIPFNRIKAMRTACESNSQRLETQLTRELEQLDAYQDALERLLALLRDASAVKDGLKRHAAVMGELIGELARYDRELQLTAETMKHNKAQIQRYSIYLEESGKKSFLERLLHFGRIRKAKKERTRLEASLPGLASEFRVKKQLYINSSRQLETQAQTLHAEGLVGRHRELKTSIAALQERILGDGAQSMVPVFESELKTVRLLESFRVPVRSDLENQRFLAEQILLLMDIRIAADKIRNASRQWVAAAMKGDRNEVFEEILLTGCQVVGATCIGINSNKLFRDVDFDVTIIDESGQIQLQNALVPISRSPKTLMLGDYKQIPPIVNEDILQSCKNEDIATDLFEQSFFEYLFEKMREREIRHLVKQYRSRQYDDDFDDDLDPRERARKEILKPRAENYIGKPVRETEIGEDGQKITRFISRYSRDEVELLVNQITQDRKKIVNLNSQFRMPGHISDVISEWFYESNYHSSYDMDKFKPVVPGTDLPMVIIDTSRMRGRFEVQPDNKMGYQNPAEAELVADVLEAVLKKMDTHGQREYLQKLDKHLGVISAYGAQVRYIRQVLCRRLKLAKSEAETAVASLDSFQGQERNLIIYSLTRSARKHPEQARVGFLKELRRLNVAFTRCKQQLVIIGDMEYLLNCEYLEKDLDKSQMPCAHTTDEWIGQTHIDECAECKADCERRFSRFFRLLMQHARDDSPAGNLIPAEAFKQSLKGADCYDG